MTVAEDRHHFQEGDFVTFSDIHGMTELNGCPPRRIHVLGPQQFTIGDTSAFSPYESFGWCKQVKRPATFHFLPLKEANRSPGEFQVTDFGKLENAATLHVAVQTLDRFITEMKRPPCPFNETDADRFVTMAETFRGDLQVGLWEEWHVDFSRGSAHVRADVLWRAGSRGGSDGGGSGPGGVEGVWREVRADSAVSVLRRV